MTTATQGTTVEERLARLEATQAASIRDIADLKLDMRAIRTEMRTFFIALLTVMLTMWVSVLVALVLRT